MNIFKISILFLIFCTGSFTQAQGNVGGGSQGVFDKKTRQLVFLDVLTQSELSQIEGRLAKYVDLIPDNDCTHEFARNLEFEPYLPDGKLFVSKYAPDERFEAEQKEALRLISNLIKLKPHHGEFLSTKFRLPQMKDATRFDKRYQIQLGYHFNRQIYIQQQIKHMLRPGHLVGVFIKEHVRAYNSYYELALTPKQLEVATFHIYKGHSSKFKQTAFAKSLKNLKAIEKYFELNPRLSDYSYFAGYAAGVGPVRPQPWQDNIEVDYGAPKCQKRIVPVLTSEEEIRDEAYLKKHCYWSLLFRGPENGLLWNINSKSQVEADLCR